MSRAQGPAADGAVGPARERAGRAAGAPAPRASYRLMRPAWLLPALAFLLIFFIGPLLYNVLINGSAAMGARHDSWFYYHKLFTDPYYLGTLAETLKLSLVVTLGCLVFGYPASYYMVRHAGRWNGVIVFLLIAPILTSVIMRTFGWQILLGRHGPVSALLVAFGLFTRPVDLARMPFSVYLSLVHVMLPFMILSITAVLKGVDRRCEEAARVLGAGWWQAFFLVTFPLSMEGVASGCVLVFVVTNGSFLANLLLGDGEVNTLPLQIYQQFNLTHDIAFASAMGNVLLVAALVCLIVQIRLLRRKGVNA
ncbi:MAG TPA: ABC transporter permease [Bordetella sp.]